ncbi:hypothetical protein B0T21DRAFT_280201 [Apiosordaria backusii]|uniref:Rhodopsin domain-containing protein n=1 Tax=Apiosordaria backusii TaxID=314023 RepID=A0AA40ESD4_9PEZI|nr:hypothetical protein B0T21DRAFT_280201 [Apiosordaria backusii]
MSVPNRGTALLAVNTTGAILAGVTCILRCFVRTRVVKGFGLDDWLMAASTVIYIAFCAFSNVGVHHGTGKHKADLDPEEYKTAMNRWYYCYLTYAVSMILVKLSIGYFLLRVTITRLHKWIIYIAAAITCVSCLTFFFLALFQCYPISYFWNKDQEGKCIDMKILTALAILYSIFSVITDLTFALLPAWVVAQLRMDRKSKMAVIGLMGMGCVASAAVIVRAPYLQHMASEDFLWDTAPIAIWSSVEAALAITAGCLACLQPLVKMIGARLGLAIFTATPKSGLGSNLKMNGDISVRRSFTRRTEMFSSANYREQQQKGELALQPGLSEYTAKCYGNTSEEELRPVERQRTETTLRNDSERDNGSKESMPGEVLTAREIS